jgi:alpha-L-fucosidase
MKRREMLKMTATMASGSLITHNALAKIYVPPPQNVDDPSYLIKRFGDGRDWFFKKRFGMFIHWGIYAISAWHEQHQQRMPVPRNKYGELSKQWNPVDFNPDEWLDLMEEAGMEYLTFTTKHLDGFCLWDTKMTTFNTMNTPYGKDILGILSEACHRRNIPLCLYYGITDWHHPNYPNEGRHHELPKPDEGDQPDWEKYLEFLKGQVRELCTNYGEIHGFWWDANVPRYKDPSVNDMIRELQPKAVINNRGFDEGDFGTPERNYDPESARAIGFSRPTEACESVGMESWGYRKDEDYFTDRYLIRSIDSYLSRDANYLLNVGPTATGVIPEESGSILRRIGKWYTSVKESYQDVEPAPGLSSYRNIMLTKRNNTLYVHLTQDPPGDSVKLRPMNIMPKSAILLNTGQPIECIVNRSPQDKEPFLRLRNLPVNNLSNTVLVAKLEFDKPIK